MPPSRPSEVEPWANTSVVRSVQISSGTTVSCSVGSAEPYSAQPVASGAGSWAISQGARSARNRASLGLVISVSADECLGEGMAEDEWARLGMMCGGEGRYAHRPVPMMFERQGEGVRSGAIYRCSICGGRKFVWRTAVMSNIEWEWKERPRVKAK